MTAPKLSASATLAYAYTGPIATVSLTMRVRRHSIMTLGLIACCFIAAAVGGAQAPTGTLCATDGSSSAKVQEVEGAFLKVLLGSGAVLFRPLAFPRDSNFFSLFLES